eukprot:299418-Amphidinium_carterae.1
MHLVLEGDAIVSNHNDSHEVDSKHINVLQRLRQRPRHRSSEAQSVISRWGLQLLVKCTCSHNVVFGPAFGASAPTCGAMHLSKVPSLVFPLIIDDMSVANGLFAVLLLVHAFELLSSARNQIRWPNLLTKV